MQSMLDLLSGLVEEYEEKYYPIKSKKSPVKSAGN